MRLNPFAARGLPALAAAAALAAGCAPAVPAGPGQPSAATPSPAATTTAAAPAPAALPRTYAARPTGADITAGDLMSRLYVLADDSMMGRQAGHRGNVMATDYIAAEFRRMGLEPAGENGTFLQTIPLVVKGIGPDVSLSVDGRALAAWDEFSPLPPGSTFPFGAGMRAQGTPVIFGGQIGGELISDAQAAGKVVVLLPPNGDNGQPNGRWWPVYPRGRFSRAVAVAVAATEISPPVIRTYGQGESAGLRDPEQRAASGPAGMSVTRAAAERMMGAPLAGMRPSTAGRAVTGGFAFGERAPSAPARNVVAVLRGSDPARRGQYVGISAHNDHEGIADAAVDHDSLVAWNTVMRPAGANDRPGTPNAQQQARITALWDSLRAAHGPARRDSIYNGADDDGSGTVALLEIAERMAASPNRPRRSVIFISHTAEESGLLGSEHFTDHPTVPRDSIVAVLNMDMVGHGRASEVAGGGPYSLQMIGSRRLSTELGDLIDARNASRSPAMQIDYSWDAAGHPANRYCRSDHFMYARYGIPITYFSLGYHPHYHMVTDEAQYIDYDHTQRVASFLHDITLDVANREARLVVNGPRQDPNAPCRQ